MTKAVTRDSLWALINAYSGSNIGQDIVNDRDQWKKLAEVRTKPTST